MTSKLNKREWNAAAAAYARTIPGGTRPDSLACPLLPDHIEGLHVLDAGCGTGPVSRYLAQKGASVVGVDISEALIARARAAEEANPLGVTYLVHDLVEQLPFADGEFDIAISVMTLMDVEDPLAAVRHIGCTVRVGGLFVFSIPHPCFYRPRFQITQWGTDLDVNHYFDRNRIEGRYIETDDCAHAEYRQFHRTLGDYLNALADCSFCLLRFVETGDTRLALSCRKVAAGPATSPPARRSSRGRRRGSRPSGG